jgi:RHS repeat-associated protein
MLQATNVVQPDGTSVVSFYLPTGELATNYGARTYPVSHTYDYAGRMKTMSTWKNFVANSGQAVTTWNYDANRGFLTSKTYDGGAAGPSYTYTSAGRLKTRVWARTITTTYSYDNGGSLATVVYSDGTTPNVTNTFDRLGRQATIACNGMTNTLSYNTANQLLSESFSGGTLAGLAVTNAYDSYLRKVAVALSNQTSTLVQYGYDNASRLQNVTNGTAKVTYTYLANSPLVSQISFTNSGTQRMVTTKTYDFLNRLTSISSAPSAASPISYAYTYNNANQRVRVALADGSAWQYVYDSLGQVISGHKFFADGTPVAGQQFDYGFDNIGNRTQTLAGGDQSGLNQRSATYGANSLNQYTNRTVPGFADIMGIALATNTVTVGGQTAHRKGEYFRDQLPVSNSSAAVWTNIAVASPNQTSITGNVFVAQSPESYSYDADGNLTGDGRWTYTWDGENRLISMQGQSGIPTGAKYKLDFIYDSRSRRIQKLISTNNGSSYVTQSTNRFLYDDWNLVALVNPASSIVQSFIWGPDLSGSPQNGGGIGGLLALNDTANGLHFIASDGNGNLVMLAKAADGSLSGLYEYGPFGEVIRATGSMAKANPFRFSTKYHDDETDLLYYGYRYYNASTGRWNSRDPFREPGFEVAAGRPGTYGGPVNLMGERGNPNLFAFVRNNPLNEIDLFGLCATNCKCGKDVTSQVFQTLQDITDTFANANAFRRWEATWSMFGVLSFSSWDILYLYNYVNPYPTVPGCGVCDRSVTFQGMCVRPNELNYIMYGWAIQVTGYPRTLALFELGSGLAVRGGEDRQAQFRKMAFATYGSDFSHNLPPWAAFPSIPQCQPVTEKSNYDIHDWRWMGLKWTGW